MAALTCAVPCQAAPCRVEVTGADSPEWRRAALLLDGASLTEDECAAIRVEVVEGGARVAFVTTDGRRAERTLANPDELHATVEALRVTGAPSGEAPTPSPKEDGEAPAPEPRAPPPTRPSTPSTPPAPGGTREHSDRGMAVIFGLQGGVRGDTTLLSPVLSGSVSAVKRRWEIGLTVASEVQYAEFQRPEPIPPPQLRQGSALVLGASAGRHEPLGGVALRAGGRVSVAALFHENFSSPGGRGSDDRSAEGRLGAYLGMAAPRRSRIRFRADMAGEVVVTEYTGAAAMTPEWSLAALLGAEIGGT